MMVRATPDIARAARIPAITVVSMLEMLTDVSTHSPAIRRLSNPVWSAPNRTWAYRPRK